MGATITTLGVGSGIDLQGMLEQLREIDQEVVSRKEDKISRYENQLAEFDVVNNKLFSLKSVALNLSLQGTYLGRSISSSDEKVATATVSDGVDVQSLPLDVTKLAAKSTWLSSTGKAASTDSVYVPVSQESTTGVADPAAGIVAHAGESMTITFAGTNSLVLSISSEMTMDDLVTAINTHAGNAGGGDNGRLVTAETYVVDGESFLRVKSDFAAGSGESNRVAIDHDLTELAFAAPDASLSYTVGNGSVVTVSVPADTSLTGLATLINDASDNPGVTASVINDGVGGTPYRLSLKSNVFGEDGRIAFVSQLEDLAMAEGQGAGAASLNAQFAVDGINFERQTNTFSDVVTGVTITLEGAGTSTVAISDKKDQVKEMILELVSAYNEVIQEVGSNSGYDSDTGGFGVLHGTTLRDLPDSLRNLMTASYEGDAEGNVTSLFDLGLEFNRDGTITMDEDVLDKLISEQAEGLEAFFLGDTDRDVEGFADMVNERIRNLTSSTGQLAGEKNAANVRIKDLEESIEQQNGRLDRKYDLMTKQFIELDRYMNQMTSLSDYLASTFDGLSKGWGTGK